MYLYYFQATLYSEGKMIGEIEYDATGLGRGSINLDVHGRTENKIKPLIKRLLEKAANRKKNSAIPKQTMKSSHSEVDA